jgi:hypothetical protein
LHGQRDELGANILAGDPLLTLEELATAASPGRTLARGGIRIGSAMRASVMQNRGFAANPPRARVALKTEFCSIFPASCSAVQNPRAE